MKNKTFITAAVVMTLLLAAFQAEAKIKHRKISDASQVAVKEVQYTGNGTVAVDVQDTAQDVTNIVWTGKEKITVKDSKGNDVPAVLGQADNDTVRIYLPHSKPGESYTFQISDMSVGEHRRLIFSGRFITTPNWKMSAAGSQGNRAKDGTPGGSPQLYIASMSYSDKRLAVDIDSAAKRDDLIRWDHSERVTVRDSRGMNYTANITADTMGRLRLYFVGLRPNETYTIRVDNINYDGGRFSVSGEFTAEEGWSYTVPAEDRK